MKKDPRGSTLWIRDEAQRFRVLLRSVPWFVTVLFAASIILMNLLSHIIILNWTYIALNAGVLVSWVSFLMMDIVTKRFGPGAANRLAFFSLLPYAVVVVVCFIISRIGTYPELDMILGGQWSILLASTIAFVVSAVVNNYLNVFVGFLFKSNPDGKLAFFSRTYVSTFVGQVVDNFVFGTLAFVLFPMIPGALQVHYTLLQCLGSALFCAVFELVLEIAFSPIGYWICKRWKEKDTGKEYIDRYCPDGVR